MFRSSRDAMILLDEDRRHIDANPAACRLLGVSIEQLIGAPVDDLLTPAAGERLRARWDRPEPRNADQTVFELAQGAGSPVAIEFVAHDVLPPGNHLWIIRDATDAHRAAGSRDESRGALLAAQSVGGFGSWEWDLATNTMAWSDHAHMIIGIHPTATPISVEQALGVVHPDDRVGVRIALEASLATRRHFSAEFRVVHPDGASRVIESHGEVVVGADERPLRLIGTVQDITDRRQAEVERRNLAAVLDTSDDAITTCSLDGIFLTWNRGAELLYGYSALEAIGAPLDLIIPEDERATDHLNWERLLKDEPVRSLETLRVTKDGRTIVVSVTRSLIVDATRGVIGVASVGRDITQRKQAQDLLAAAHADALAASAMKSQFLANMSHEIRTPMNGVLGMNELLLDTALTDEQRTYAEQVARSGQDMMAIINDILDLSKIEAGQLELDVCDFVVRETIEQACSVAALDAQAKGLRLDLQIADEMPQRAHGDDRRLRQVLLNLVSNAVKFTSTGTITVRARRASSEGDEWRLRIEVADTGIGIDPDTLERMFEPFTQADASVTRRFGGTGLGLAIARDLTDLMGGEIGADSRPGAGSTFWFELDLAAPMLAG